jgi:hypothetical protein
MYPVNTYGGTLHLLTEKTLGNGAAAKETGKQKRENPHIKQHQMVSPLCLGEVAVEFVTSYCTYYNYTFSWL